MPSFLYKIPFLIRYSLEVSKCSILFNTKVLSFAHTWYIRVQYDSYGARGGAVDW
jgi:hypothetical protein